MIILRNKIYSSSDEDTTGAELVGAASLLGTGGVLIGTSGKKAQEGAIKRYNRRVDKKISKVSEDMEEAGKEIIKRRNSDLQKEAEIINRRMRVLDSHRGIKGRIEREITKKKAKKREKNIKDSYHKELVKSNEGFISKQKKLNALKKKFPGKIKAQAKLTRGIGYTMLPLGVGLAAASGYNHYLNKKERK